MSKQDYNVLMIHNHDPGWEEEWGRIVEALLYGSSSYSSEKSTFDQKNETNDDCDDMESNEDSASRYGMEQYQNGPLYRACKKVIGMCSHEPYVYDKITLETEEFLSYLIERYQIRVDQQDLFKNYQSELGNVIGFLCSSRYLRHPYQAFRKAELYFSEKHLFRVPFELETKDDQDDDQDGNPITILDLLPKHASPSVDSAINIEKRQKALCEFLQMFEDNIVINRPSQNQTAKMAGLQLYMRLLKTDNDMLTLQNEVREEVAKSKTISNSEAGFEVIARHEEARQFWLDEKKQLNDECDRHKSQTNFCRKLELQFDKRTINYYLRPIVPEVISDLYKMSLDNAKKSLNRYQHELSFMFSKYQSEDDMEEDDD